MNVLVTGATGTVGTAVTRELLARGHKVTGLARSPEKAARFKAGFRFARGELTDTARLRQLASQHEAIIHAAAIDSGDWKKIDSQCARALLEGALEGGASALLYTGGVWSLGATGGKEVDESGVGAGTPYAGAAHRPALERELWAGATTRLRVMVIRPAMIFGGDGGLLRDWIEAARKTGAIAIPGPGANRWPTVHAEDVGALYRLVLERGVTGRAYHATDDSRHSLRETAEAFAHALGVKVTPLSAEAARKTIGPWTDGMILDQRIVSPGSRALGWTPKHPDLVAEAAELVAQAQGSGHHPP